MVTGPHSTAGWLFDNAAFDWADGQDTQLGTIGQAFIPTNTVGMKRLAWYRSRTGPTGDIYRLTVWDTVTQAAVYSTYNPPDNGQIGWQEVDVSAANVFLTGGRTYVVCVGHLANNYYAGYNYAGQNAPTPGAGLSWPATIQRYKGPPGDGYPNTADATKFFHGVDVSVYQATPPPPDIVPTDVQNALADWFDPSDATKPTGDTKLYPRVMQALDGVDLSDAVAGINANIDANGVTLDAVAGDVAAIKAKIASDGVTLDAKIGPLHTYGGVTNEGLSYGVEIVRQQVADANDKLDQLTGVTPSLIREWLTLSPDVAEPGRWTLAGTTVGEGNGTVADQADLYRVDFTAIPPLMPQHALPGGVTWLPRAGWCAPIRDGYVGPRKFLDFSANDVRYDGQLMHGLVIYLPPGLEWQVGAYVLDRS